VARGLARASRRVLSGKLGIIARVAFPLILLAVIFVPLQRALAEVASEVETRREVDRVRDRLVSRLEAATGRLPYVEVTAVPDAQALDAIAARLRAPPPPPVDPPPPSGDLFFAAIEDALAGAWPTAAGELRQVRIIPGAPLRLEVVHLGPALGTSGAELLARELERRMRAELEIVDVPLPVAPLVAVEGAHETWLGEVVALVAATPGTDDLSVCVDVPPPPEAPPPRRGRAAPTPVDPDAITRRMIAALVDPPRVASRIGPRWQAMVSSTGCAPESPPAADDRRP
jgi:hypothetical protein